MEIIDKKIDVERSYEKIQKKKANYWTKVQRSYGTLVHRLYK